MRKCIRISLVLNNNEQYEKWKKLLVEEGYGNFSQMIRSIVEKYIEKKNEPFEKSLEPIINALDGLYRQSEAIRDKVDTIDIRLQDKGKDENSEVYKAVKEIKYELSKGELTIAAIVGKLNYSEDVIKRALVLLKDVGFFVTKRRSSRKNIGGK